MPATPSSACAPPVTAARSATGKSIELGEAVGVIAAQSIGEPGTQLTMRTFHTGGVAGKDIAGGLPRVVELFEARTPRGAARLARASGVVRLGDDEGKGIPIRIVDDGGDEHEVILPVGVRPSVSDGQEVTAGDPITDGPFDPKDLIEIKGIRETQHYLVDQVQKVYREQGVSIHDKHIELIVRQMTRRVGVQEPGDAGFLPGERVDAKVFRDTNRRMVESGQRPAEGRPEIMGITKASLATDSWLSAASFQETTRVLTEAAIDGRADNLIGLKENIIIGKLIPAGTGMHVYREFDIVAPDYEPMTFYSTDAETEDAAAWLSSIHGTYADGETAAGAGRGHHQLTSNRPMGVGDGTSLNTHRSLSGSCRCGGGVRSRGRSRHRAGDTGRNTAMTQYLLSVHVSQNEYDNPPEGTDKIYAAVDAFNDEVRSSGAWVFAGGLHAPDTATVVDATRGGDATVTDGPYAETKEQIGGFWVIEAADLDAALEWAKKASAACAAPVEVRPFQDDAG